MRATRLAAAGLLLALAFGLAASPVRAQGNSALYQATAIVTGTDLRQRPLGFARCLRDVLVKVSGKPGLRDDPKVAALAEHAEALSDSYAYVDPQAWRLHHDDQGTYDRSYEMTVDFDPAKVDAALATLGAAPWRGQRPLLEPLILVRPMAPTPYLLSAETPRGVELRASIVRLAGEMGLGVRFPTDADFAAWGVGVFGFPAPLGAPEPGRLRVTGSLAWEIHALGWVGLWRAGAGAKPTRWGIRGVDFDQAFADLIRGAVSIAHGDSR